MIMAQVRRSPLARADLKEVLAYTHGKWGAEQAGRYATLIDEAVDAIRKAPHLGRPRFGVRSGILAHHIGRTGRKASHLLYYRIDPNGDIEIVRFLHERMDPGLHL